MEQHDPIMPLNAPKETAKKETRLKNNEVLEWVRVIALAVILAIIIRWFFLATFLVEGPSMQPNFWTGEKLFANKILYKFRQPKPGEVIVFHEPKKDQDLIKRVIGVAGDTIEYRDDDLYVNGMKADEPYIKQPDNEAAIHIPLYHSRSFLNQSPQPYKVPKGHIFVMGDNRENSTDSRILGPIPLKDVIGRADVIFLPLSHAKLVQHHSSKLRLEGAKS